MKPLLAIILIASLCLLHGGCTSYEQIVEQRSRRLLEIYPPNVTSRDDVRRKWDGTPPDIIEIRSADGWTACPNTAVRTRVQSVELCTGKHVAACDSYRGVDGLFSLCRCWFFFDDGGRLIDAQWQYVSD